MLIALNKPFNVLCQFTDSSEPPRATLAQFGLPAGVYPAGRLDFDSEGLMLLSDDGDEIARISSPKFKVWKTYWAQVEGIVSDEQLARLQNGVQLNDGPTRPAKARRIPEPANLWPRNPPIRERKNVPDSWLELSIAQGKNRQVRRMTAAVGLPTLRLIRAAIGDHRLEQLQPGQWRQLDGFEAGTPARASVPRPAPGNDLMDPHKPMLIRPWKRDGR